MKRAIALTAAIAVMAVTTSSTFAATKPDLSNPSKVIKGYLNAKETGDVGLMEQYSIDNRYDNVDTRTADLTNDFKTNPLLGFSIVSSKEIDSTHVEFGVSETFKNGGQLPTLPMTVVKENGDWKLNIESLEINNDKSSTDFGKIVKKNINFKGSSSTSPTASTISPFTTTEVLYWSFTGLYAGASKFSSATFDQKRTDGQVTLNGWQADYHGEANITYTAVTRYDSNTWRSWGYVPIDGDYYDTGDWYAKFIQGVPYGTGYNLLFTNNGVRNVDAAGNAYE